MVPCNCQCDIQTNLKLTAFECIVFGQIVITGSQWIQFFYKVKIVLNGLKTGVRSKKYSDPSLTIRWLQNA
jgi:hypothetical protein